MVEDHLLVLRLSCYCSWWPSLLTLGLITAFNREMTERTTENTIIMTMTTITITIMNIKKKMV